MKTALSAWLLAVGLTGTLVGQDRALGEERFQRRREYFLGGDGSWFAENPGYRSGDSASPSHFGYQFAAGPAPSALSLKIIGLVGKDTVEYWSGVYYWHPGRNRAEYRSLSAWGSVAEGRSIGPSELQFDVVAPDGSVTRHLDREDVVSSSEFRSTSYAERDGRWILNQTLTWKRGPR